MLALKIDHLVKRYGDLTAVNGISFDVPEGEFFGLLGPNGAGKTTTINSIVGLSTITSGSIQLFGLDVEKDWRAGSADGRPLAARIQLRPLPEHS